MARTVLLVGIVSVALVVLGAAGAAGIGAAVAIDEYATLKGASNLTRVAASSAAAIGVSNLLLRGLIRLINGVVKELRK